MATQATLTARCSHGLRIPVGLVSLTMELVRVWETFENWVVPGRFEKFQEWPEQPVQNRMGMSHVKIQRKQITTEMQFGLIIEWAAPVPFQAVRQRPAQDVAKGVKI